MLSNDYVRCPIHKVWMRLSPAHNGMSFHTCYQCLCDEAQKFMDYMLKEYGGDNA